VVQLGVVASGTRNRKTKPCAPQRFRRPTATCLPVTMARGVGPSVWPTCHAACRGGRAAGGPMLGGSVEEAGREEAGPQEPLATEP
jgi:hypothetical protein